MNTADSEEMAQPLLNHGMVATDSLDDADVAIMNSCTVREHAEHKALSNLGRLRTWKSERPERLLIFAGCAATLWGDKLKKKYPHVDLVSPATQIEKFPEIIQEAFRIRNNGRPEQRLTEKAASGSSIRENLSPPSRSTDVSVHRPSNQLFGSSATAYVTIMRGCNLACSYCIVPRVRGRESYRAMPEILAEIRTKAAQGFHEVMLLGQTVNSYFWREDDRVNDFADLLRAVDAIEGIESIRFMSPHPKHMRQRVIDAIRECRKVARHVHLPLQSGSSRILAKMKRLYTREEYRDLVSRLRVAIPDLQLTTDVIVGYPDESAADFEETVSLLSDIGFNGLFAFKYSPRPGTDSASLDDNVTEEEKELRLQQVLALARGAKPI